MATAKEFEDLRIWQQTRQLVCTVYSVSKNRAFYRDCGLRDQIRRAAASTMSNIAEGFELGTRKEFVRFLDIAKGSIGEVRSQLYIAMDQQYLSETEFTSLHVRCTSLSRQLAAFIRYLEGYPGRSRVSER